MSLLLSGILTGVLVGNLEETTAQQQLDQALPSYRLTAERLQCAGGFISDRLRCPQVEGRVLVNSAGQYVTDLHNNIQLLPSDRLLLVGAAGTIVYDSQDPAPVARVSNLGVGNRVNGVYELTLSLGATRYLAAATKLGQPVSGNPIRASWVILARSRDAIAEQATNAILPKLLLAGGVSLLVALVVTAVLGTAMVRPLRELASAAEDIAAGNYSRRVRAAGRDEIGVLGRAFNRMAEAVEKARGMQRDFLANVSHELKTPLTSLIGFSQALVDGSLETEADRRRAATILHEEAVRVLRMSQELLDLARVEGGHLSLLQQPVDLGVMLGQEIDLVRTRAEARDLTVGLQLEPELPPVKADPERLHQILENLLDNAVKYAPPGSRISIWAGLVGEDVRTTVSNPVGAHPPDPERMFERFYRADPSRSSGAGGVGLGLAISRELASAQLGRLWASFDGEGRLCLNLDLQAGTPESTPGRVEVDARQAGAPEPATIQLTS